MQKKKQTKIILFAVIAIVVLIAGIFGANLLFNKEKAPFKICVQNMDTKKLSGFLRKNFPELKYEFIKVPSYNMAMENNLTAQEIAALPKLKTEIMSGNGPDLFILPAENTQLLQDLYLAAGSGVFADISGAAAKSENFKQCGAEIMKAGQYDGKQYLAPLSFNVLGILSDADNAKALQAFNSPAQMLQFAAKAEDGTIQRPGKFIGYIFKTKASSQLDYAARNAHEDEQLKDLLLLYKDANKAMAQAQNESEDWKYSIGAFNGSPDRDIISLLENSDKMLVLTPVPNGKDGVTVTVENYAAISAASRHKKVAEAVIFDFLLSKQAQGLDASVKDNSQIIFTGLPVRFDSIDGLQRTYNPSVAVSHKLKAGTKAEVQKIYDNINAAYIWDYEQEILADKAGAFVYDFSDIETVQKDIVVELQKVIGD